MGSNLKCKLSRIIVLLKTLQWHLLKFKQLFGVVFKALFCPLALDPSAPTM